MSCHLYVFFEKQMVLSTNESRSRQLLLSLVDKVIMLKYTVRRENMSEKFQEKKRFVRYKEGAKLYGLCQSTFEKRAKEAGATYKVGKAVLVDCEIFEKYLESFRIPAK